MAKVIDANGILRLGPTVLGASLWTVVGPIDDTTSPYAAEVSDFITVGDLDAALEIVLPASAQPADQVAIKLWGDLDGNDVTVTGSIDGAGSSTLTVQYQQLYLVCVDASGGDPEWAILESGEGVAEVFSVFADTGNVLPNWSVAGENLATGGGALNLDGGDVTTGNGNVIAGTGYVDASLVQVGGIVGAATATRYVGGTAAVAPVAGDFLVGDWVVSANGSSWVCTVAGSPGTWVEMNSVLLAPKAAPTFSGVVTSGGVVRPAAAAAVTDAPRIDQLTSALTITSGTLPNTGAWASGTAKQNPVARQITVAVEFVSNGTANAATCAIAISSDNVTYTTVGTLTVSVAVNTVGALTLCDSVILPSGWWIKLTFAQGSVAASIYY